MPPRLDCTLTRPIWQDYIGAEPSGLAFNARALDAANRPHNPYINSGAIMACSLVAADQPIDKRFDIIMDTWRRLAGGVAPGFNNSVFLSERGTADRNCCLAYMMKECGSFPGGTEFSRTDLEKTLEFYFMCCSIESTCRQMSVVAATLANGGLCPLTNERIFKACEVQNALALMQARPVLDQSHPHATPCALLSHSLWVCADVWHVRCIWDLRLRAGLPDQVGCRRGTPDCDTRNAHMPCLCEAD